MSLFSVAGLFYVYGGRIWINLAFFLSIGISDTYFSLTFIKENRMENLSSLEIHSVILKGSGSLKSQLFSLKSAGEFIVGVGKPKKLGFYTSPKELERVSREYVFDILHQGGWLWPTPFSNSWISFPRRPARRERFTSFLKPATETRSILGRVGTDGIRVGVRGKMGGQDF